MRPGLTCVMSAMQAFFGGNLSLIFASLSQSEVRRDYSASVSASVSVSTSCVVALERTWSRTVLLSVLQPPQSRSGERGASEHGAADVSERLT